MPGGDGTGPGGMGPMTGRAAGICAGYGAPGYVNRIGGRCDWGRGFGGGRGWRNWFHATGLPRWARGGGISSVLPTVAPEQELNGLKEQAKYLGNALEDISKRIGELESLRSAKEQVG